MEQPFRIAHVIVPTIGLYCTLVAPHLERPRGHQQVFGSADYYLDLSFHRNPDRTPDSEHSFTGTLVGPGGEQRLKGMTRTLEGRRTYLFQTVAGDTFRGQLVAHNSRCEPDLDFTLNQKKGTTRGKMRAGFCL